MDKVLCLVRIEKEVQIVTDEDDLWLDLNSDPFPLQNTRTINKYEVVTPLIDHLHNDVENGQKLPHYHIDTRYADYTHNQTTRVFPDLLSPNERLEYRYLKKIRKKMESITDVRLISKSKLKHNCIHKGKCPHRGYDLSDIKPDKDGIIICPLHGLRFDSKTKALIY